MSDWERLVRFIPKDSTEVHIGEPDPSISDVGLALFNSREVSVNLVEGDIFSGRVTGRQVKIGKLLAPIAQAQCQIVRCIGLNYHDHAEELSLDIPKVPTLFIKPSSALADPFPGTIAIPKAAQDDTCDYEAELAIVIKKTGRDIPEHEALDYVLGYTCANDVTARSHQLSQSQWCFAKGMDGFCPIGPVLVSPSQIRSEFVVRCFHNGDMVQDGNTKDFIFPIERIISFVSQGTTLAKGSVILTGTPAGVGYYRNPRITLKHHDEVQVYISQIGTLVNKVEDL